MGLRDKAIVLFLYNTGARAQELVDTKIAALRLDEIGQVTLTGKGQKQRSCPLWPETVEAIKEYLGSRKEAPVSTPLFLNANGLKLTRFGLRYIVRKYTAAAIPACPNLKDRVVTTHTFRHATALHLIQAGVDFATIMNLLGHRCANTTHAYIQIDMEMKRKALESCSPPAGSKRTRPWHQPKIMDWLAQFTHRSTPEICAATR